MARPIYIINELAIQFIKHVRLLILDLLKESHMYLIEISNVAEDIHLIPERWELIYISVI